LSSVHKHLQKYYHLIFKNFLFFLVIYILVSCQPKKAIQIPGIVIEKYIIDSISIEKNILVEKEEKTDSKRIPEIEQLMLASGLVNIKNFDSTIKVHLIYSTSENFMHRNLYGELTEAYLQAPVAQQLVRAQKFLKDSLPGYRLIVYDAARPLSIQKIMWDSISVPKDQRWKYLSNPMYGSLHNYGAAVDVSIIDAFGNTLDMGTPVDYFGSLAYPVLESYNLATGKLTREQIANRNLLRTIMKKASFNGITTEWWHFNACRYLEARNYYSMLRNHTVINKSKLANKSQNKEDVSFKIQVKLSQTKIDKNSPVFKGLNVHYYQHKGLYKYVVGEFKDIAAAYEYLEDVEVLGFKDAFIIAFNKDERIDVKDAIKILQ